jgi:hypothetical protein
MTKYYSRQSTILKKYKVKIPKLYYAIYGLLAFEAIFMLLYFIFEDALTFVNNTSDGFLWTINFSWGEAFSQHYLPVGYFIGLLALFLVGAILTGLGSYLYVRSQFFNSKDVTKDNVVINNEKGKITGYVLYFIGFFMLILGWALLDQITNFLDSSVSRDMIANGTFSKGRGGRYATSYAFSIIIVAVIPYAILMGSAIDLRRGKKTEQEIAKQYKSMNF